MGASSVTGVGPGSAEPYNRGSEHHTIGAGHILGPHISAAGTVTLSGGTATVYLANTNLATTGHGIFAFSQTANAAHLTAITSSGGNLVSFALAGTGTDVVAWQVVRTGLVDTVTT